MTLPATWAQGDFDYNGVVDFDDILLFISANLYNTGIYLPAQRVPAAAINLAAFAEPPMQPQVISQLEPVQATLDPIAAAFASLTTEQASSIETSTKKKQALRVL